MFVLLSEGPLGRKYGGDMSDADHELDAMVQAMTDEELLETLSKFRPSDTVIPLQEAVVLEIKKRGLLR